MRARVIALVTLASIAVVALSYRGWAPSDDTWSAALEYPNRGAAADLDPADFESAQTCASCHARHHEEWSRSAMGRSSELSVFLVDLYATSLELRGAPKRDVESCLQCHAPAAIVGAEPDLGLERAISREGVTCDICHTAVAARPDATPGGLQWDPGGPKRGPWPGTTGAAGPDAPVARSSHHATAYSPLHGSSQLCGTCHMSLWPTNGLPIDWTYAEWERSEYAPRGVECQDCHMPTYTGSAAPGAPVREALHRHDFPGGADEALVRSAARLAISARSHFAAHEVEVVVENHGAGHAFPTGNATAPVVELRFVALDTTGAVVFSDSREYKLVYLDADGVVTNDPTVAYRIESDTTLQPGERRRERFFVPTRLEAVEVRATLVYRRWGEHLSRHDELASEFLGRYLAQGAKLHRLLGRLDTLAPSRLDGVRGYAPIVVDEAAHLLEAEAR